MSTTVTAPRAIKTGSTNIVPADSTSTLSAPPQGGDCSAVADPAWADPEPTDSDGEKGKWARPHLDPGAPSTLSGIYSELVTDWVRSCELPTSSSQLRKWAKIEPALAGISTLPDLLDAIDGADHTRKDAILLALIKLAQSGRTLAGKAVLQAMLPKLYLMALKSDWTTGRLEEQRQIGVSTFWEVLSTYPTEKRTRKVASNLSLDTLHLLTAKKRSPLTEQPTDMASNIDWLTSVSTPAPVSSPRASFNMCTDPVADEVAAHAGDAPDPDGSLLSCVAWGVDVNAITPDEASTLVRVYAPVPGEEATRREIAAQIGISEATLRARCSRSVRKLTTAVREHAAGHLAV